MLVWTKSIDDDSRNFNLAAMTRAGFTYDPGRTLSAEEVAALEITKPGEIRDKRVKGHYHWNRGLSR